MNEKFHYLQPSGKCKLPKRFAVMTAKLVVGEIGEGKGLICNNWDIADVVHDASWNRYRVTSSISSLWSDKFSPWEHVFTLLRRKQTLDLWILNAMNVLRATGFFNLIDKGKVLLESKDWKGKMTLTNPPIVIVCRSVVRNCTLRVLCMGNLGINGECDFNGQARLNDEAVDYMCEWFATIEREKLGAIRTTIAGQAWSTYRHRFMKSPILCHANNTASELESHATHGGRAECFKIGDIGGPLYHYDVISCYPKLLRKAAIPCRLKYCESQKLDFLSSCISQGYAAIADITLTTELPIFPKKTKIGTIFPIGKFRTTLLATELASAIAVGAITQVHAVAAYETDYLFGDWCKWAVNMRRNAKRNGNETAANVAKLLTNSLWGRFARRDRQWQNDEEAFSPTPWSLWYERDAEHGELSQYRCVGWLTQRLVDNGYDRDSCPVVTAYINSIGRSFLWELINIAGRENVAYCATDSLVVNSAGKFNLDFWDCSEHGQDRVLSMQAEYKSMRIRGIHHYDTDSTTVSAGIPSGAKANEHGLSEWLSVEPISGPLSRGECPSAMVIPKQHSGCGRYSHGNVDSNGIVTPLILHER